MKSDTIARTVAAAVALTNSIMVITGKAPLELDENTVYVACSTAATIATTIAVWWKNNSFTKVAQTADDIKNELKTENVKANQEYDVITDDMTATED